MEAKTKPQSKAARCLHCGVLIKLEPCDQCDSGYFPEECIACGGEILEVESKHTHFTLKEKQE